MDCLTVVNHLFVSMDIEMIGQESRRIDRNGGKLGRSIGKPVISKNTYAIHTVLEYGKRFHNEMYLTRCG